MPSRRPNIILCTCDQLRAFEVGCYGNDVIRTPGVDRLAAEGMRFQTAVSTFPVCMAARSALLSGQYNRTCTGGVGNVSYKGRPGDFMLPEYPYEDRPHLKDPTLAETLRDHNYHTQAIGKWHIHSWPHDVGFDRYLIPRVHHCHTGQLFTDTGSPEFSPPGYSVDFEAEQVATYLEQQANSPDDQPFFLYYNISVPHNPFADAPDEFISMYKPDDVPVRANVDLDTPLKNQDYWFKVYRYDFRYYSLRLPYTEHLPEGYSLRHLIAEYYGMTTWMDTAVARMLDALDRTGLAGDTIVVFTSDHGDNLGSHGLVQKGGPNEESSRIPMVIRCPDAIRNADGADIADHNNYPAARAAHHNETPTTPSAGAVHTSHVASLIDLAPTLLSLVRITPPAHMAGRDLSATLRGQTPEAPSHAIIESRSGAAIRSVDYLYALPFAEQRGPMADRPTQLFDMNADPSQLNNLVNKNADGTDAAATNDVDTLAASRPAVAELDAVLRTWNDQTPWMAE